MSTTVTISGTDRTGLFDSFRFRITRNKRTYNKIRATLKSANFTIEEGEEILATIDSNLEFGGLLQDVTNKPTTVQNNYTIYATGYEQICDRRTISIDYTDTDCDDIVNGLITDFLSDEGITVGNVDTGANVTIQKTAISIKDTLDELAVTSGYVWFIDNDKKLYFQDDYNYTSGTFPTDYEVVETGRSLTGYANKVFVLGANSILAVAEDATEISKMGGRFGSGVYGTIIRDANADTSAKALTVAEKELAKRNFDKKYVKIKTRSRLVPGTIYTNLAIPYTDTSAEDYAIDEVMIEGKGDGYWYTATLEPYDAVKLSKNVAWQEKFREFLNKANNEATSETSYGMETDITTALTVNTTESKRDLEYYLPYTSDAINMLTLGYTATASGNLTVKYYADDVLIYSFPFSFTAETDTRSFQLPEEAHDFGDVKFTIGLVVDSGTITINDYVFISRWEKTLPASAEPVESYGEYELISDVEVSVDTTAVDLTGLSLTSDDEVLLVTDIINPVASTAEIRLNINNNGGTNQEVFASNTSNAGGRLSNSRFTYNRANGRTITHTVINVTDSNYATWQAERAYDYGANTLSYGFCFGVCGTSTSTITSMKIQSQTSNSIGVGSRIWLYRKGQT